MPDFVRLLWMSMKFLGWETGLGRKTKDYLEKLVCRSCFPACTGIDHRSFQLAYF